jgi:hypothetical protein
MSGHFLAGVAVGIVGYIVFKKFSSKSSRTG